MSTQDPRPPFDLTPAESALLDVLIGTLGEAITACLPRLQLVHVALELETDQPFIELAATANGERLQ